MNASPMKRIFVVVIVLIGLGVLAKMAGGWGGDSEKANLKSKNTILRIEMRGVILNGRKFIKNLKRYREEDKVKAFVIDINSPGGAVGPSQEIFAELKRTREEFKKPVICVSTGVMASGAYYAAAACDQVIVAPGALVGSIGVIMEFANLERLYDWAKVTRYSITSGRFKDSGAEYRAMRDDERVLFQDMINEVYQQFRATVKEARKLNDQVLDEYADGRVFTGTTAVKMGFADKEGYFEDAVKTAAEVAGLGEDYELSEIPKKKMSIFDLGERDEEDNINSLLEKFSGAEAKQAIDKVLRANYLNQPLFLMPGYWE